MEGERELCRYVSHRDEAAQHQQPEHGRQAGNSGAMWHNAEGSSSPEIDVGQLELTTLQGYKEMVRCRLLCVCDIGDPITCIYLGESGWMAGSMMGKVWSCNFYSGRVNVLASFSDEGIRGLYLDEHCSYATVTDSYRCWPQGRQASAVAFRSLDRKNAHSVKYVVQRGPWACVLFPMASTVVNLVQREHHHRAFKLMEHGAAGEVVPCDFDGETLALIDRSKPGQPPVMRLVQLERDEQLQLAELPDVDIASLISLWGQDCLVYAVGNALRVYDYRKRDLKRVLQGHWSEIVAVDAQSLDMIASLCSQGLVKIWHGATGECVRTLRVPEAGFFMGFPYYLRVLGDRALLSSDEGVHLVEIWRSAARRTPGGAVKR